MFHDGVDILEVDIDASTAGDNLGDTLGGSEEDVVGHSESFGDVEVAIGAEFVVVDDDDGVDMLAEFLDACLSLVAAALAFEGEGTSDDGHDEDFLIFVVVEVDALCNLSDDRSSAGAGATTHTGGDEEHLGVVGQGILDVGSLVDGGLAGAFGLVAGTEAEVAEGYLIGDRRGVEGLHVGITDDKIDTFNTLTEHVVDSIAATTSHTDDFDVGRLSLGGIKSEERCLLSGLINEIGIVLHVLVYFYLTE